MVLLSVTPLKIKLVIRCFLREISKHDSVRLIAHIDPQKQLRQGEVQNPSESMGCTLCLNEDNSCFSHQYRQGRFRLYQSYNAHRLPT